MPFRIEDDAPEADDAKVSTVYDSKNFMQPNSQDQPSRPRRKAAEDGEQRRRLLTNIDIVS